MATSVIPNTEYEIEELKSALASKFKYSSFTVPITTQTDSDAIGGNRGYVYLTTTIDPNYSSDVVAIVPLYANKHGSNARPLYASIRGKGTLYISSAFALNNDDVDVEVMYVYN